MLVATGAAIFVLLSFSIKEHEATTDVTRIIAQVVTGVGFLGAGIIFRYGANVHGLSSAAIIWCSAAIGCLAATGLYIETLVCTFLVIVVSTFLNPLDTWLKKRKQNVHLRIGVIKFCPLDGLLKGCFTISYSHLF